MNETEIMEGEKTRSDFLNIMKNLMIDAILEDDTVVINMIN